MPTYQYQCNDCGEAFEIHQSFSDDALTECPTCGGHLRKLFNAVGVVFKGSGFYRTDSRAGNGSSSSGSSEAGSGSSSGSSSASSASSSSTSSGTTSPSTPTSSGSSSSGSSSCGSSSSSSS